MAQVVLTRRLADEGLDDRVTVASAGTGDWHVGQPMDPRASATLAGAGYDGSAHRARQYDESWLDDHDLVLAMDHDNLVDLGGRSERVGLFRDFDPEGPAQDVPDPYYGGDDGFRVVLALVERTAYALAAALAEALRD
jgi:protein-tyrosine phosphatase